MANRITEEQIKIINDAYLLCGTYSGAAKAAGCSPSTAKKYIIPGWGAQANSEPSSYNIQVRPVNEIMPFTNPEDIYKATEITNEEKIELQVFWKEIMV